MGLLLSVQLPLVRTTRWSTADCRLQPVLNEAPSHPGHRREAHVRSDGDLLVGPRWAIEPRISLQQDPGMGVFASRTTARGHPLTEGCPFVLGQRD